MTRGSAPKGAPADGIANRSTAKSKPRRNWTEAYRRALRDDTIGRRCKCRGRQL